MTRQAEEQARHAATEEDQDAHGAQYDAVTASLLWGDVADVDRGYLADIAAHGVSGRRLA